MGIMKRLAAESAAMRRKPNQAKPKKDKPIAQAVIVSNEQLEKVWLDIPRAVRLQVLRPAIREAAQYTREVLRKALAIHDSSITGSELLQTWDVFNKRQQRRFDLRKSVHYKIKTYDEKVLGMVGPRRSEGNHAHLLEFGYNNKLWGKGDLEMAPTFIFRDTLNATKRKQAAIILKSIRRHRFDA